MTERESHDADGEGREPRVEEAAVEQPTFPVGGADAVPAPGSAQEHEARPEGEPAPVAGQGATAEPEPASQSSVDPDTASEPTLETDREPASESGPAPASEPSTETGADPTAAAGPEAARGGVDAEASEPRAVPPASAPRPRALRAARRREAKADRDRGVVPAEPRAHSARRLVLRVVGSATGLALVAAAAWAFLTVTPPTYAVTPGSVALSPVPGEQLRVCPGPLLQLGLGGGASDAAAPAPVGTAATTTAVTGTEATSSRPGGDNTAEVVRAPGSVDGTATSVAAQQFAANTTSSTSGISATACATPAASQWLLSGATTLGESLVLQVINPGTSEVRVTFDVVNQGGRVAPAFPELILQPGETHTASVAGIAPDSTGIAIRVSATGGTVAAYLHETLTNTLTPGGSEIVGATQLPATTQILPGMTVLNRPGIETHTADASKGSSLRLLNPGSEPVPTVLTISDQSGTVLTQDSFAMDAGRVIDYPLGDLPTGTYTVRADADGPILLSGRTNPQDGDFAWQPSSPVLRERVVIPVSDGPGAKLAVANPTTSERTVTVTVNGTPTSARIVAGGTAIVDIAPGTVVLDDAAGLAASIHFSATGQRSSVPVLAGDADAETITVVK